MTPMRLAATLAATLAGSAALADCAFENTVPLRSLTAGFEAWKAATDAMAECGNFEAELDQEFRTKQPEAFAAEPSLYHIGGVSNETIVPLINAGTIRPLDDLVAEFGQDLRPNQLITIDGQVMAIAMMVNAQHLMYRQDVLEEAGVEVPATYDEFLAAAEAIRAAGIMEHPVAGTYRDGWNIALDFINIYFGMGGTLVNPDGTPAVNNETGVATLELMRRLSEYMDPEYLTADSTVVQQQFQQGEVALANFWASRGGAMDDEAESQVVGLVSGAPAPRAMEGGPPASTIWWDGIVIARNITDEEAEAAFRVALEGIDPEMVAANQGDAIWLSPNYEPSRLAQGAIANATAEPPPPAYPSTTAQGLMHGALGSQIGGFFTGARSAEETLAAVEEEYLTAAREAGVVQ